MAPEPPVAAFTIISLLSGLFKTPASGRG